MSVRPIDLQINISQMDHVSRALASSKEAQLMAQAALTDKVEKEAEAYTFSKVKECSEEEHLSAINLKDQRQNKGQHQEKEDDEESEFEEGEIRKEKGVLTNYHREENDPFKDDDLGLTIDLKG